ncbi:MAG: polymer-forming cytoskeletal protein [bacterium]
MFKTNEKNIDAKEAETIIGPSVKVEGDFAGEGNVAVEGIVMGNLKTNKNLSVGVNAQIFANIKALNALIAGHVEGNINVAETLELTSTARIKGDIKAKVIAISAGAVFHGKCDMGNGDTKSLKDKTSKTVVSKDGGAG